MTDDELIDRILSKLNKEYGIEYSLWSVLDEFEKVERLRAEKIFDRMKSARIVDEPNAKHIQINAFGASICNKGGWLQHLKSIENKEIRKQEIEQLEIRLANSNIEANKINKINSNRNLIFSIINIILAIGNIILLAWQLSKAS